MPPAWTTIRRHCLDVACNKGRCATVAGKLDLARPSFSPATWSNKIISGEYFSLFKKKLVVLINWASHEMTFR
jgi:hypothetical protein